MLDLWIYYTWSTCGRQLNLQWACILGDLDKVSNMRRAGHSNYQFLGTVENWNFFDWFLLIKENCKKGYSIAWLRKRCVHKYEFFFNYFIAREILVQNVPFFFWFRLSSKFCFGNKKKYRDNKSPGENVSEKNVVIVSHWSYSIPTHHW